MQLQLNFKKSLDQRFIEYHQANPEIYDAFENMALKVVNSGRGYFGARFIFQYLRWQTKTAGSGEFKINNNYIARYVRLFEKRNPQHQGFFKTRKMGR